MKRFQIGMFISYISYVFGYTKECLRLGYNRGKNHAQSEID